MDEIDEWLIQLENDITEVVTTECKDIIEDKMHENSNLIYEDYEPWGKKPYIRRKENGGYGDKGNIHTQIINNGNGDITLLTSNDTKGNSGETNTKGDNPNEYIDYIIEEGGEENYKWRHGAGNGQAGHKEPYDFPLPRPVSEWTMDDLNETNIIENTIEKSLKSKGYNIK